MADVPGSRLSVAPPRPEVSHLVEAAAVAERLLVNVEAVVRGKRDEVVLVLTALACRGHVLFEDVPGTAKTVLARAIAQSIDGARTTRIQCTPDLQPTDVTGLAIYNQRTRDFEFRPGPIFANVVLVDEINRAMPKTQSALLEAMAERQVTVDRFFLRTALGYPGFGEELRIIDDQRDGHPLGRLRPAVGIDDVVLLQQAVGDVYVDTLVG